MLQTDRPEFDRQITVMMGGFPGYFLTPERIEAYWRGLQKMQMSSLTRVVDFVLSEDGPEKIPSVSVMWDTYRKLRTQRTGPVVERTDQLSREQHIARLRRMAITQAKREKMPKFNGVIVGWEYVPERKQAELKQKWADYETQYGDQPDSFWEQRAQELMRIWGETKPEESSFDFFGVIA